MEPEVSVNLTVLGLKSKSGCNDVEIKTSTSLNNAVHYIREYIKSEYMYQNQTIMLLNGMNVDLILKEGKSLRIDDGDKITVIPFISGG